LHGHGKNSPKIFQLVKKTGCAAAAIEIIRQTAAEITPERGHHRHS
jgi:hypothetical protein